MKPVVMIPKSEVSELEQYSDLQLFEEVLHITLQDGPLTTEQIQHLNAINQEFIRRDLLAADRGGR
jgi:hypothetical protein